MVFGQAAFCTSKGPSDDFGILEAEHQTQSSQHELENPVKTWQVDRRWQTCTSTGWYWYTDIPYHLCFCNGFILFVTQITSVAHFHSCPASFFGHSARGAVEVSQHPSRPRRGSDVSCDPFGAWLLQLKRLLYLDTTTWQRDRIPSLLRQKWNEITGEPGDSPTSV